MSGIIQTFIRHLINIPVMITSLSILYFTVNTGFWISSALAIGIYITIKFYYQKNTTPTYYEEISVNSI